jgi:hypothetical protein
MPNLAFLGGGSIQYSPVDYIGNLILSLLYLLIHFGQTVLKNYSPTKDKDVLLNALAPHWEIMLPGGGMGTCESVRLERRASSRTAMRTSSLFSTSSSVDFRCALH